MMTGQIHSFESFATLDGEGIRFAVFLAGCPLRCVYCHNPDTWYGKGQSMSPEQLLVKIKRFEPYFNKNGGVTFSGGEPLVQAKFVCEVAEFLKKENIKYALDTSGGVDLTD
ncbi:MAG: 4Fe-4S cluster-binding domain-containing protein, partial [Clostridia bacterium]